MQAEKIKKHEIIKDKEKLFKKLFISPSYCQPLDPPLLVSPDFINLLLQQSNKASREYQLELLNDILNVFAQRPTNSLLLCAHDQSKIECQKCIMDDIVFKILMLIQTEQQVEVYLERISLMLSYYRIGLRNFQKLTQYLSKMAYQQKFDHIKLMFILRLIKIYYSRKLGQSKSPRHFFYIFGSENAGIQPVQHSIKEFGFKNELTITLSFNSQGQPFKPFNLFLLKTQKKQQIGLTYHKGTLKITALNNGEFLDEFIIRKELSQQVWYRLIINLNTSETECIVENQIYKNRAFLKRDKERKIVACVFGREFFGMLGSIMVSNKNISLQKFDKNTYLYGIDSIHDLKTLSKSQLQANMIIGCFPFFTFEVRQTLHCFDIFRRNHSAISDNILTVGVPINEDGIEHLGGFSLILPLFYLARFYNKSSYHSILEDLLSILLQIMKTYNVQKIEMEFQQTYFLQILGQHLADIPHLQTQKSLNLIFTIYRALKNEKTKLTFIHDIVWALNIGIQVPYIINSNLQQIIRQEAKIPQFNLKASQLSPTRLYRDQIQELISQYYKKLLSLYKTDSNLAFQAMSISDVIYWAVQRLETNENMAFSCCLQHHLNQSVLSYEMGIQQFVRLDSSHAKTHYHYVEEILSNYLQNSLNSADETIIQQLKALLRLFLQKYSSCFYLTILRSIKRQIIQNPVNKNKRLMKLLTDSKLEIISFMVFLSEKTINPDIISEILYISLFVQQHSSSNRKEEVSKFIINLMKINQSIQIKNFNPLQVLVKKIRKSSQNFQCRNQFQKEMHQQERKKRRKSMVEMKQQKFKKISVESSRLFRIIERCPRPERLSTYKICYNIILNQLSGLVSEAQPTNDGILCSNESILVMKEYYKLAQPSFKESILLFVLSSLEKTPELKFTSSMTTFLLQCLRECIYVSPQETKSLLTIFTCIFSQIILNHNNIVDYYCSIKFLKLSRSAISLVLPHVMSKVIKLVDFKQLCDLMILCLYQLIQSPGESALQLVQMIICEVHIHLNRSFFKNIEKNENKMEQGKQKVARIEEQYKLLLNIASQHPQKGPHVIIKDIFENKKEILSPKVNPTTLLQKIQYQWQQSEAADIKQMHVLNQNGLFELVEQKNSNLNIKKPCNQYYKQLTYFEIYVKLFFKVYEKMEDLKVPQYKRESMKTLQTSSYIKKSKSAQISYSYEFKTKQTLVRQFVEFAITFFNQATEASMLVNSSYIKFILSYVMLESCKHFNSSQNSVIRSDQLFTLIFNRVGKPFLSQYATSVEEVLTLSQKKKVPILQFFLQFPFKVQFQALYGKKPLLGFQQIVQKLCGDQNCSKFFAQIEDLHDLMLVGFFQKSMQKYVQQHETLILNFASEKSFRNIQKLFDTENSAEQKTRITYLYQNECNFRKYHFQWDKLWNNLRIYHKPYGLWMAQKFKDNIYTYPHHEIRNFKFQMSEYSSASGLYPILQAKILESWAIIKDNRIKKNKYINSFSEMMKPSHIKLQKSQTHDNIFTNMWRGMLGLKRKNSNKVHEHDVVLICRSTKALGKLFIQNKQDLVFCYEGARQEDTHLSFQKFSLAFNRETYQKWSIYSIQKVKIHRYLLRYEALQIVFCDGRSIIFDFVNCDKDDFIKELQKIQKQKLQKYNLKLFKLNKVPFLDEHFFDLKGFDMRVTQSWIKREMSNLEYLTKINRSASRGIYDLSQYMVVPWVVQFKKEKEPKYRDLTKTMGGLGSEERKKIICEKYYAKDPFNPYPPFFFGTHYSSPGVVFNILIRLSPFTEYCKHLQGGKFDIPDRLFSSLVSAWRSASQEVSDVRQLIPEIYYLPQMLINIDENYFGYTQNHELIEHVEIPPWGANNPYFFTSQLRQIMESEEVSENINEWIDLIFGFKQKGKQAELNYNVYYYLTYEEYADIQQGEDDVYKKSKQAQIVHFGQVPPQLFEKPHPKRNKAQTGCVFQLKIVKVVNLMNSLKEKPIGMKISSNQLLICKRNQFQVFSTQSEPAALQKKKKFNFEKNLAETYFLIKKEKSSVVFLQRPYFIVWGYLTNQFRIIYKNSGQVDQMDELPSKITSLMVNKAQDLILIGLESGVLAIFEIQYGLNDIFIKKIGVQSFPSAICHISEQDGFYAITFGNYCAIYKINRSLHYLCSQKKAQLKFFRSFYNQLPLKQSFIMGSPLYTLITVDNANIKSYSINGQLIRSISNTNAKYYGRFKDHQLHDVFYAIDEDKVIAFSNPDLRFISILDLFNYQFICDQYILYKNCIEEIGFGAV